MKIELEVSIPDGYEATGEYRYQCAGEWYLSHGRPVALEAQGNIERNSIILRKVEPVKKMRQMTHDEILYIITSPHCVIKFDGPGRIWVESGRMMPGPNTKVGSVEYGFVREDGTVDGPYKFEKEV